MKSFGIVLCAASVSAQWTQFFNRDTPSSTSDYEHRSDTEAAFLGGASVCDAINPAFVAVDADCTTPGGVDWADTDDIFLSLDAQGRACSPDRGLTCFNNQQVGTPDGECEDYQVRYFCADPGSVSGDPHFYDFAGGEFDVMGEADHFYNIISHPDVQLNAQFVEGQTAHNSTFLGDLGLKFQGQEVALKAESCSADVDGIHLARQYGKFELSDNANIELLKSTMVLRVPPFHVQLTCINKQQSVHFNMKTSYDAHRHNSEKLPHGILGQTTDMVKRSKQGKQGEGAIEGVYSDYEVSDLFADDFAYSQYSH